MVRMAWSNINHIRLLRYAGLTTYLCVALPLLPGSWSLARVSSWWSNPNISGWVFSYLMFGVTYVLLTRSSTLNRQEGLPTISRLMGLTVLTVSAIAMGWFSQSGLSAMLMLVIAVVLPWQLPAGMGLVWMLLQNLMLIPIIANYREWTLIQAVLQVCMYLAISALVYFTSMIASQQAEEREIQRRLNSELRATRALLAESTRIAERMRIARDLHDLVGQDRKSVV